MEDAVLHHFWVQGTLWMVQPALHHGTQGATGQHRQCVIQRDPTRLWKLLLACSVLFNLLLVDWLQLLSR